MITNCPNDRIVDHINRCKYDHRIDNLRVCTYTENNRNLTTPQTNKSGKQGVRRCICHRKDYWQASINDDEGRRLSKCYSVFQHGNAGAKQMAIEWRKQKEQELGYIGE